MIEVVLCGAVLLGAACGAVGCFTLLQRRALAGDVLAHAALPGLCLALLVVGGRSWPAMVAGAATTGVLGFGVILGIRALTRVKEDAALGIVLSTFFAAGVVLLSLIGRANIAGKAGIDTYIYGQAAGLSRGDVAAIGGAAVLVVAMIALLFRPLKTVSFDRGFAESLGWSTGVLDILLMAAVALITVVGLQAVGVILISAMLIAPGAAARLWTDSLPRMLVLAAIFGAMAAAAGVLISTGWIPLPTLPGARVPRGLPTGPSIVLCGAAIYMLSLAVAPQRGLLTRACRQWAFSARIHQENVLRTLYELHEPALPELEWTPLSAVAARRGLSRWSLQQTIRLLCSSGDVVTRSDDVRLTEKGRECAAALTRRHRLWELYLIHQAGVAADHVDRDADWLEHHLPPELLSAVEREVPTDSAAPRVPSSPHGLGPGEAGHG